jgi:hypothetical protein
LDQPSPLFVRAVEGFDISLDIAISGRRKPGAKKALPLRPEKPNLEDYARF